MERDWPAAAGSPLAERAVPDRAAPPSGAPAGPGNPLVGVLALQGGVREHVQAFLEAGVSAREVRSPAHLDGISALVIPGGESTTLMALVRRWGLDSPIIALAREGLPVWGTCAGAVLLSRSVIESEHDDFDQACLGLAGVRALRNAFGRQSHSFTQSIAIRGVDGPFPGVFIRAPLLQPIEEDPEILCCLDEGPVFVRQGNLWLSSFHPELTGDDRVHRLFLRGSGIAAATGR
ncbi:pyridoxal 5'-phosphate synthase glutaminase subunit PdxT [Candidatus Fermentibacterales bacterium]|nr:pyridoxal 5'-phosphate synthase glutaminase subunit PdxT [Candidatus Fermentibacterales bacterium]